MRYRMLFPIVGLFALLTIQSGCSFSGHSYYYESLADQKYPKTKEVTIRHLNAGDFDSLRREEYADYDVIGKSSFVGAMEDDGPLRFFAKSKGANVVFISREYESTAHISGVIATPQQSTTYHSGNVYSNQGSAVYSGTSTQYSTQYQPYTLPVTRYTQTAWYLRKKNN